MSAGRDTAGFEIVWNNILVPIDFSPASQRGIQFAGAIGGRFTSRLYLLHVIEPPVLPQWGYAHLALREAKLRRAAAQELKRWASELAVDPQLIAATEIRSGGAQSEICQAAAEVGADLIVIASHGLGFRHAILGSTAERVVRHAPCHVLTVQDRAKRKNAARPSSFALRRVLVTTDFSAESLKAFPYARALSGKFGAALTLLHVVPSHLPLELSQLGIVLREYRLVREAEARLSQLRQRQFGGDLPIDTLVLPGAPAHDICSTAERQRADLIVIATRGHTGLKHYLLGSVAENVVRHAPCPVLVVREREHGFVKA